MELPSDIAESTEKTKPKHKPIYFIFKAIALIGGLVLIGWFVSKSNPAEIWAQLRNINIKFLLLVGVTFIAYLLVSIAWMQSFLEKPNGINIINLFTIRLIGESLAQVNPTNIIAGETLKAVLLKHKGVDYKSSIVSLTISRFLIMLSAITLVIMGAYIFFDELTSAGTLGDSSTSLIIIIVLTTSLVFLLIMLLHKEKGIFFLFRQLLEFIARFRTTESRALKAALKLKEIDEELIDFYKHKKIYFISAFLLSMIHWLIGAVEMYLILHFIGVEISFLSCIAVEVGVMVFKAMASFVPGQIGIEEMANKLMLEVVNVSGSTIWVTVSILRRARQLFWILIGFIAFFIVIRRSKELKDGNIVYNS